MDDDLFYKLIDDGGCQFPDTHIFPYNGCKVEVVEQVAKRGKMVSERMSRTILS